MCHHVSLLIVVGASVLFDCGSSGRSIVDDHVQYAPLHDGYKPMDYSYSYGVKDPHTGDVKSHWEKKEAGVVRGRYALVQPDGVVRTVDYSAGKDGFNAIVKQHGLTRHPITAIGHANPHRFGDDATNGSALYDSYRKYKTYHETHDNYPVSYADKKVKQAANQQETIDDHAAPAVPPNHKPTYYYAQQPKKYSTLPEADAQTPHYEYVYLTEEEAAAYYNSTATSGGDGEDANAPTVELSDEEIARYLEDYYKTHGDAEEQAASDSVSTTVRGTIPHTYRTGKRPNATPGLKNYSSKPLPAAKKPEPVVAATEAARSVVAHHDRNRQRPQQAYRQRPSLKVNGYLQTGRPAKDGPILFPRASEKRVRYNRNVARSPRTERIVPLH